MKKILIATDGSDDSAKALAFGSDLAIKYGAEILLVHVVAKMKVPENIMEYISSEKIEDSPGSVFLELEGKKIVDKCELECVDGGVERVRPIVVKGDPAIEILKIATENGVDAIILSSREEDALLGRLLGSVTRKVLHAAQCTCIIVK